ncbi:hypothetical protein [Rhodopila sp.]|uniref:hypothetical protein n=1 Tax=Rhodopila sp. TaxID=2480087 RepID=UPI003D0DD93E
MYIAKVQYEEPIQTELQRPRFVTFRNRGLIDVRAITTFGISAKDPNNTNPIGYFGTGLKYAIAVLLRHDIPITIMSGLDVYKFSVRRDIVRSKPFELVCMNGELIGFTTDLGKNWELWQAFRELYSNCVDEFGKTEADSDLAEPLEGVTQIIVESDKFVELFVNRSEIFIQGEPFEETEHAKIHGGQSNHIFYRGIRISTMHKPLMYRYDIQKHIDLTEDRTVKFSWQVSDSIVDTVLTSDDEEFIESILTAPDHTHESTLDFMDNRAVASDTFRKVAGELRRTRPDKSNTSAMRLFERDLKVVDKFKTFKPDQDEQAILTDAIDFLAKMGYYIDEYPIIFVETLGESTLAIAEDGKIVLTQKIFNMGRKMLALGLLEEFIHLKYGYTDCSRSMQSHLFELVVRLGETVTGQIL